MKKNHIFLFITILMIAIAIFYLKKPSQITQLEEFRFQITADPPSLDWSLATDHVSADILFNLMEGLIQYDEDLNPIPALAERWNVSSDGKRYTFHLRKGVLWTDGKPLTANDFVYGWQRLLNPKTAADYAYFLYDIVNAKEYNSGKLKDFNQVGVHAKDDETLVVDLWHPASYFISIHAFWVTFPMRKDIVEAHGDKWSSPEHIVTLGPFKLNAWQHDYKVVLEANPLYYGEKPKIKYATAYVVNEDSTALSLYETNKLDLLRRIPSVVISKYQDKPDYQNAPYLRGYYYGIHTKKKPFNDARVRRAFSLAIDRTQFPKILGGGQIPLHSWVPQGMLGHAADIGLKHDLEKARRLLTEAGYPNGKNFPKVMMAYDTRDDNKVIAENLQSQWKETLGIHLEIENSEWKVHLKTLETDPPHLWRLGWGADFPDPDNFLNLFTSYSGNNFTRWANPTYDKLIEEGAKELDAKKRVVIYNKAQQILTEEDLPIIPLFMEAQNLLLKPYVRGFQSNAMAILILKNVYLEK